MTDRQYVEEHSFGFVFQYVRGTELGQIGLFSGPLKVVYGLIMRRRDPGVLHYEFDAANKLGEMIRSIWFSPFFLVALAQLEEHGHRRLARQATLGPVLQC